MPTKKELLENRTVKDLRQMARDKDLSGYSGLNKSGLITLIEETYKKSEIKNWPDLGIDEVESTELTPTEEEEPEEESEKIPMEEMEVDQKRVDEGRDWITILLIIGSAIAGILAITLMSMNL